MVLRPLRRFRFGVDVIVQLIGPEGCGGGSFSHGRMVLSLRPLQLLYV
jgi:hypothetical protein